MPHLTGFTQTNLNALIGDIFIPKMSHQKIALEIYKHLISEISGGKIPISMESPSVVGTVQDDPFDAWVGSELATALPDYQVIHSGKLTTPDIIIRDPSDGSLLGLEVKKLIQKPNGSDPRGLTIDFNSSIPCGRAMITVGADLVEIPCFYVFALLNTSSDGIVTLLVMDGDFLNYDFDLHKEAKVANTSEYGHGPYGEGSVRRRAMYTYPNPLNHKLNFFHLKKLLVIKKIDADNLRLNENVSHYIDREDIHENVFTYSSVDLISSTLISAPPTHQDIFAACKSRVPKVRTATTVKIDPLV